MTPDPTTVICEYCGHPASAHARNGCYHRVPENENGYCSCDKTQYQALLLSAEATISHQAVLLTQYQAALARALALLDKFAQCEPVSLDEVVAVLSESGELLAGQP